MKTNSTKALGLNKAYKTRCLWVTVLLGLHAENVAPMGICCLSEPALFIVRQRLFQNRYCLRVLVTGLSHHKGIDVYWYIYIYIWVFNVRGEFSINVVYSLLCLHSCGFSFISVVTSFCLVKYGRKLLIHSHTSTAVPLDFHLQFIMDVIAYACLD